MSIRDRIHKIRAASLNVVITLKKTPFITHYGQRSLSDPTVNYQQKIEWTQTDKLEDISFAVVECECHQVAGVGMPQPDCKENSNGTVCYHSLAALIKRADDKSQSLSLFDHFSDAARYANFGGRMIKVISAQGEGKCWGVSKKRETFSERVDLMRGEVEEGID